MWQPSALRRLEDSIRTQLAGIKQAQVEQAEAIRDSKETDREGHGEISRAITGIQTPETDRAHERAYREKNYAVQVALAIVTFLAFLAAAYYASIAKRTLDEIQEQTRINAGLLTEQRNTLNTEESQFDRTMGEMYAQLRESRNIAHTDQRAWIGISEAKPVSYQPETMKNRIVNLIVSFTLRNYGRSAAQNVRFLAVLNSDPSVTGFSCNKATQIHAAELMLPTQEFTYNWVMPLTEAQIQKGWTHQNPQLGHVLILDIQGCIEYSDREREPPHRTPFRYLVYRTGGFITPGGSVPTDQLLVSPSSVDSKQAR